MDKPNPATHVKVGAFHVPAVGVSDYIYVETDGPEHIGFGSYPVYRMLEALGVPVNFGGWASWDRDYWKIEGDKMLFDRTIGTATPSPRHFHAEAPVDTVRETLLLMKCPHKTKYYGKTTLRNCEYCVFYTVWDESPRCSWGSRCMKPLKKIWLGEPKDYVNVSTFRDHGYGSVSAILRFDIIGAVDPDKLINSLHEGLDPKHNDDGSWSFTSHYGFKHQGYRASRYGITVKPEKYVGFITARESGECWSWEDWEGLKRTIGDKVFYVIRGFARVCDGSRGRVSPVHHGKHTFSRWRDFERLDTINNQGEKQIVSEREGEN